MRVEASSQLLGRVELISLEPHAEDGMPYACSILHA